MRKILFSTASLLAMGLAGCMLVPEPAAPAAPVAPAVPAASAPAPAAAASTAAPNTLPVSRVVDLGQGVSMLMGQGGNLGLSVGNDGAFMIDDQYATNAEANLAKIEELAKGKPKYLVNTHWHGDHAGGNAVFQAAGTMVFAHTNVRKRLSGQLVTTGRAAQARPAPKVAWPVVTFDQGVDFHLNGQTIRALKVPAAHTDGDVIVYFLEADVLHMGDVYVKNMYPFIDTGSGGTLRGYIEAQRIALNLAGPNTKIIPGHGELAKKSDLEAELAMIEGAAAAVDARVKAGDTLQQALAAKPLSQWTVKFGGGFMNEDAFVTAIYGELTKK
jgi:cyclase